MFDIKLDGCERSIFDFILDESAKNVTGKYGYVYLTFNMVNGKKYIGQSGGDFDEKYFGSGKRILAAIKKYGIDNFRHYVIEWCDSKEHLNNREIFWIRKFNAKYDNGYYNIIDTEVPVFRGEENPFYGKHHSQESKDKRQTTIDNWEPEKKEKLSKRSSMRMKEFYKTEEGIKFKEKLSKERRGKKPSLESIKKRNDSFNKILQENYEEFADKVRRSLLEFYQTEEGIKLKEKFSMERQGRTMSEATKLKISEKQKGRKHDPEHVNKINKNPEKIRKTAEKHRGMKRSKQTRINISNALSGRTPHNKGYKVYHDPINKISKLFGPDEEIPVGFIRGSGLTHFYDPDTLECFVCFESDAKPNWVKGRIFGKKS